MSGTLPLVDAEPTLHLEPHFAVVRNFEEIRTLLEQIADPESVLPNMVNVPVPESMLGSTINRVATEYLTTSPGIESPAMDDKGFPAEPAAQKPSSAGDSLVGSNGSQSGSPLVNSSASPTRPKPRRNRILCVWDVDDTLVASGTSGVRQHPVFRESQMTPLFRSLEKAGTTRHLLLSQGSIDDVFAKDGTGRLRYLQKYFFSEEDGKRDDDEDGHEKKSGFGGFACGKSKATKKPSILRNPAMVNRNTQVVRLGRIYGEPVKESEVAWLSGDGRDAPEVENGSVASRWLFVRPSLAGISLCSLNTPVLPSPYTAFVDGKALRKLDVVWSLAVSGHWDNVFFIDNNLSEVGVVTNNMQMSHLFDLQSEHKEARFFHNELAMLAVSGLLRTLCYQHSRDVTIPPQKMNPAAVAAAAKRTQAALDTFATPRATDQSQADGKDVPPSIAPTEESGPTTSSGGSKENGADHTLPLTPSGSSTNGSTDTVNGTQKQTRAPSHVDPLVVNTTVFQQPIPQAADALSSLPSSPSANGPPEPRVVRMVIANLHIPFNTYKKLLTSRSSAADDGTGGAQVVLSQKNVTRRPNNMAQSHYRGQPLFNKDTSCSDDQYESIIRMFRQHLGFILDMMVEDLRQQGYILINPNSKYPANISQVMVRVYHVPTRIPCIKAPYQKTCQEINRLVLTPLQKGGGRKEGVSSIKSCAHSMFQRLVQSSALVDPLVIGGLCAVLVDIYMEEGSVSKSQTARLETQLNRVLQQAA